MLGSIIQRPDRFPRLSAVAYFTKPRASSTRRPWREDFLDIPARRDSSSIDNHQPSLALSVCASWPSIGRMLTAPTPPSVHIAARGDGPLSGAIDDGIAQNDDSYCRS